jgi:vancomycin resistance protein YoaR
MGASGTVDYDTQTGVNVATTTGVLLAANPRRLYAAFKNLDSSKTVSLKLGADAVDQEGVVIGPGGSFEMNEIIGNLDTSVVNAIHDGSGTARVAVVEGIPV